MLFFHKSAGLTGVMTLFCLALAVSAASGEEKTPAESASPVFSLRGDLSSEASSVESASGTAFSHRLRLQTEYRPVASFSATARVSGWESFDPEDGYGDSFLLDRFFVDWQHLGETPFGFSAGRLPTASAPSPSYLHLGKDAPESRLSAYTDIIIDGGAVRFDARRSDYDLRFSLYAGTQTDLGYECGENPWGFEDTFIYGAQATAAGTRHRFALQFFVLNDLYNLPEDYVFPPPFSLVLHRKSLGNIYQTSASWLGSWERLDSFVSLGWSRTDPDGMDELGTSLLGSFYERPQRRDGYAFYTGLRYDLKEIHSKVGLEYNYGSKYWLGLQGEESGKLATRGSVLEIYWLFLPELPKNLAGIIHSVIGRAGYLYSWYDYTGSGFWLGTPIEVAELIADPINAQFFTVEEHEAKLYAGIDITF